MTVFFYGVAILCALVMLISFFRSGHFIRSALSSMLQGCVSLLAVNVLGTLTGVVLSVNPLTLATVGLLGIPGTIGLVVVDCLL